MVADSESIMFAFIHILYSHTHIQLTPLKI